MKTYIDKHDIEAKIKDLHYTVLEGSTTTVCRMELANGFSVIGTSACASPENFDEAIGRKFAYEDAFNKVWPLEGYLLKQRLFEQTENNHGN